MTLGKLPNLTWLIFIVFKWKDLNNIISNEHLTCTNSTMYIEQIIIIVFSERRSQINIKYFI